ncbi:MAG TPA: BON domain-containing protein [Gaiellaceae bacterium]|nr:BON domain-containing protein [Gaiellaceae bacterium]
MKRLLAIVGGAGAAIGGLAAFFLDKDSGRRRRKLLVDRTRGLSSGRARKAARAGRGLGAEAYGTAMKVPHPREVRKPQPDDATLARKVETEIFRPGDVPKGSINVNAENGVVYLRGEVPRPEMIEQLVAGARRVRGVRGVENLLHLPNTPAETQL